MHGQWSHPLPHLPLPPHLASILSNPALLPVRDVLPHAPVLACPRAAQPEPSPFPHGPHPPSNLRTAFHALLCPPPGPLTNVALALRLEPRLPQLLRAVVVLGSGEGDLQQGGGGGGNVTPHAEYNYYQARGSRGWDVTGLGVMGVRALRVSLIPGCTAFLQLGRVRVCCKS